VKTLSLLQPWASLVAIGAKKIETRSWAATKYRGPLAIHASARFWREDKELCRQEPFRTPLFDAGLFVSEHCLRIREYYQFPLGAVIAVCRLEAIYVIGEDHLIPVPNNGRLADLPSDQELSFGDYTPGRYAWILSDVRPVEPIPCKGRLGLWNLPEGIEEMIRDA
jgi:hypothetical protein